MAVTTSDLNALFRELLPNVRNIVDEIPGPPARIYARIPLGRHPGTGLGVVALEPVGPTDEELEAMKAEARRALGLE